MRFSRNIIPVLLCLVLAIILSVHLNLLRHKRAGIDFMADRLRAVPALTKSHAVIYVSVIPDKSEVYFSAQFVLAPLVCLKASHPDSIPVDSLGVILLSSDYTGSIKNLLQHKKVLNENEDDDFRMVFYKKIP